MLNLFLGNTDLFTVTGLKDETGTPRSDATGTATLKGPDSDTVAATFLLSASDVAGDYYVEIPDNFEAEPGRYRLEVILSTSPDGLVGRWVGPVMVTSPRPFASK